MISWLESLRTDLPMNRVAGLTGTLGLSTAWNGIWPGPGLAAAVAQAVAIGTVLWAEQQIDVRGVAARTLESFADVNHVAP